METDRPKNVLTVAGSSTPTITSTLSSHTNDTRTTLSVPPGEQTNTTQSSMDHEESTTAGISEGEKPITGEGEVGKTTTTAETHSASDDRSEELSSNSGSTQSSTVDDAVASSHPLEERMTEEPDGLSTV